MWSYINYEYVYLENWFLMPLEWILIQLTDLVYHSTYCYRREDQEQKRNPLCAPFVWVFIYIIKNSIKGQIWEDTDYELENLLAPYMDQQTNTQVQTI